MNNHNLYEENYFDMENEKKYCGSSQIKSFMDCEARTMAKINGEWTEESTTALLVGSYVDAAVSGTLDLFKAKHPEILKKDGSLKSEYVKADYILNRIELYENITDNIPFISDKLPESVDTIGKAINYIIDNFLFVI